MNAAKASANVKELQRRETQRRTARRRSLFENLTVCIGCGCDDMNACDGGCGWLRNDGELGVCSECPDHVNRFDKGDRRLSTEARLEVDLRKEFS